MQMATAQNTARVLQKCAKILAYAIFESGQSRELAVYLTAAAAAVLLAPLVDALQPQRIPDELEELLALLPSSLRLAPSPISDAQTCAMPTQLPHARATLTEFQKALLAAIDALPKVSGVSRRTALARQPGEIFEFLSHTPLTSSKEEASTLRANRLQSGSFFTPAALIARLCALAEPENGDAILDPALGCGYFLLGCTDYMEQRLPPKDLQNWAHHCLYGCDINPQAVAVARLCLWLRLSRPDQPFLAQTHSLISSDSLLSPAPQPDGNAGFACVIGNPPYDVLTSFARCPEKAAYAAALRASGLYSTSLQGQLNLYRCFLERALQLLTPGGRLCFLVPATLAADRAAQALREELLLQHGADAFYFLGENDPSFPGICQATVLVRARKDNGSADTVQIEYHGKSSEISARELKELKYIIPRCEERELRLLRWLRENATTHFGDLVSARVGEVDQTVYRESMSDSPTGTLLLRGCHLSPFQADLSVTDPRGRYLNEKSYLRKASAKAENIGRLLAQPRVVQMGIRNLASLPRLIAAILPAGVYCGNSINVYYPQGDWKLPFIAALLNSELYDLLFRLRSTNNNINLHEVLALPFPADVPPDAALIREIEALYSTCAECATAPRPAPTTRDAARYSNQASKARILLNQAINRLFQLPEYLLP